jgi:hypothetical protein
MDSKPLNAFYTFRIGAINGWPAVPVAGNRPVKTFIAADINKIDTISKAVDPQRYIKLNINF